MCQWRALFVASGMDFPTRALCHDIAVPKIVPYTPQSLVRGLNQLELEKPE